MKRIARALAVAALACAPLIACSSAPAATSAVPTGGFPTAKTTGPTAWAMAQHWTTKSATTITKSGTYELIHFNGPVVIAADNVRLINDTVTVGDDMGIAVAGKNAYISRVIVHGQNSTSGRCLVGIKDRDGSGAIPGTLVDRTEVYWCSTGMQDLMGTIQNSYIHAPGMKSGDHINGITQNGSTEPLVIKHNRILDPMSQTDAISLFCDFGSEANVTIEDNYLAGGGYTFYGGNSGNEGHLATSNIRFENNVFGRNFFHDSGFYGYDAYWYDGASNIWSNNRFTDGTIVPS